MSYIKTFMEDYLKQNNKKEIYNPVPIKYIIYNSQTRQFRSSNILALNHQYEYFVKVLNTEDEFTIFISHPIEYEYFFIELVDCEIAESRIYDYYDFYDIKNNDIDITQEYTVFIDCYSNTFNITTTKYSSIKKIDTFEVIYFSRE
jgi:hypothetical protein